MHTRNGIASEHFVTEVLKEHLANLKCQAILAYTKDLLLLRLQNVASVSSSQEEKIQGPLKQCRAYSCAALLQGATLVPNRGQVKSCTCEVFRPATMKIIPEASKISGLCRVMTQTCGELTFFVQC